MKKGIKLNYIVLPSVMKCLDAYGSGYLFAHRIENNHNIFEYYPNVHSTLIFFSIRFYPHPF